VPGLPAKDVIDVQVTVAALDRERLAPALARAGFVVQNIGNDHRPPGATGPDEDWRKLFFHAGSGRPVNLHVRAAGRPNQRYPLLFRDYLAPTRTRPPRTPASSERWPCWGSIAACTPT